MVKILNTPQPTIGNQLLNSALPSFSHLTVQVQERFGHSVLLLSAEQVNRGLQHSCELAVLFCVPTFNRHSAGTRRKKVITDWI